MFSWLQVQQDGQPVAVTIEQIASPAPTVQAPPKAVLPAQPVLPQWLQSMLMQRKTELTHAFVLHGNIGDYVPEGSYGTIYQYLSKAFSKRKSVMFYSISTGLRFATEAMEQSFRREFVDQSNLPTLGSAIGQARQQNQQQASLDSLIGKSPDQVLPLLERALKDRPQQAAPLRPLPSASTASKNPFRQKAAAPVVAKAPAADTFGRPSMS
jgi:hypothetical protein